MNEVGFLVLFGALALIAGVAFLGGGRLLRNQRVPGANPTDDETLQHISCCGFRLSTDQRDKALSLKRVETGE